jgi:uncharacterized protein YcbX
MIDERALDVPIMPGTDDYRTTKIWSSSVRSEVYSDEINRWFSEALGTECRLVAMPEGGHRAINPIYAVRQFKDEVSYADGYPFMLLSRASLDDLNSRLAEAVPMNRFRPNFVIADTEPFAEDKWKIIRIGSTVFHVVKPSERCVLTTVDQEKGEKTGKEPLRTLSIFRTFKSKVLFGQNLIAENTGDAIKVGDRVEVFEAGGLSLLMIPAGPCVHRIAELICSAAAIQRSANELLIPRPRSPLTKVMKSCIS